MSSSMQADIYNSCPFSGQTKNVKSLHLLGSSNTVGSEVFLPTDHL